MTAPCRGAVFELRAVTPPAPATRLLRSVWAAPRCRRCRRTCYRSLRPAETAADITGSSSIFSIPIAAALGTPSTSTPSYSSQSPIRSTARVSVSEPSLRSPLPGRRKRPRIHNPSPRLARSRLIVIFFGYVFAVAVTGGLLAQAVASLAARTAPPELPAPRPQAIPLPWCRCPTGQTATPTQIHNKRRSPITEQ